MSDLTSAYNVAENIYLLPQFNALCGFREAEIAAVLSKIATECDLPQSSADEALSMMRTFYHGYRFSRNTEEQVYNPTLALYFLKVFQRDCRYPDEILDSNLARDRGKMHYISRLSEGRRLILDALAEAEPVHVPRLADRFGVEDMRYAPKDTGFVASLLYYFGILTLGSMTPFGELILTIPNLWSSGSCMPRASRNCCCPRGKKGIWHVRPPRPCTSAVICNLCAISWNRSISGCSATADYAWSNELTVKTAFLTLLFNDTLYITESEAEMERGHADLTMIVRPDMRQYQVLDILIEFKFVSLNEAGLDGKTLETMDREALQALPAVQGKQREAEAGLARYRGKLNNKFGDLPRLRSFSVVAVGFERLVFSPSE